MVGGGCVAAHSLREALMLGWTIDLALGAKSFGILDLLEVKQMHSWTASRKERSRVWSPCAPPLAW